MHSLNIPFALLVCFSVSLISALILRRLALKMNLVDAPDHRKSHVGRIPLVGGISIFMGVASAFAFFPHLGREITAFLIAAILIVMIGLLDDQFDLKVRYRLSMQFIVSLVIIIGGDMRIETLGVFGSDGVFHLGAFSVPFTIFSIMVAMNAFNFIDGIDGLSGLLFMIAMLAIIIMCVLKDSSSINNYLIPLVFFIAIIPYMAFNLGLLGNNYRVFLGDAGSMLLGLTVAWLLINYTQDHNVFSPVTALWIIAVPLMDMLAIVVRRVRNNKAPFHPDRNHLHHLFIDRGMGDRQALIVIGLLSLMFAAFGILSEIYSFSELTMLIAFLVIFFAYYQLMSYFEKYRPVQSPSV
jgi:UDP-GlcNAc:undecaprenyl-phosphate GlcNAc-1-phosphate transferase